MILILYQCSNYTVDFGGAPPFFITGGGGGGGWLFVRALARGLTMTYFLHCHPGESVVPLNCLVFFLPWWLYDANCRMDFKDSARRSTANVESNIYIFSTNL